jgi:chorismate mutase
MAALGEGVGRTADKLIILLDYSNGLLTRLHGCITYEQGLVQSELADKVLDHLSQRKEDPTLNLQKQPGHENIAMKAEALENECQFCYQAISDVLMFTNEVMPLFDGLVRNITIFDLHRNTDLTSRFLGVFFNFVKIYFLANRITTARVACYLYILAYKEHTRNDPEDAHLVKAFLFANQTPLKQLQTELARLPRIADVISDTFEAIMPSIHTWTNYESIKMGQYFSVSQDNPEDWARPVADKNIDLYSDASQLENVGTYIILHYMIFPQKVAEDKARDQLAAALNDRTVVQLHRNQLMDAVAEYKSLQKNSLSTIKVPKQMKKVVDNIKYQDMAERHTQMRELLRREIRGLLDLVTAIPGVIAVKLPILMACLALARYEIFWIFTHLPPKDKKDKSKFKGSDLEHPRMPDLMYHCLKLFQTILANKDLIHKYYTEQLMLDLKELEPYVQICKEQTKLDKTLLHYLDSMMDTVRALSDPSKSVSSLEGLRLSWYRASADASKEPSVLIKPVGQGLVKLVSPLVEHSRYYDRLEKEVDARGSMAGLWFFRGHLAAAYNAYCLSAVDDDLLKAHLSSKGGTEIFHPFRQGRYWIVFLQIFSQALLNVHRQMPEELPEIGTAVLSKVEAYLSAATSKIEMALKDVLLQYSFWNTQTLPLTVAEHLIKNKGQKGGFKQLPGFESYYPNRAFLENLKYNLDVIGDMCSAFGSVDNILIYDQKIFPNGYLRQALHNFFYHEMREIIQENPHTMVRPSRFVSRLERLFRALSTVNRYCELDTARMVRDLLYTDFYDDSVGIVGTSLGVARSPETLGGDAKKNDRLIHDIRDWYVGLVDSRCASPGSHAVYSPVLDGFYDLKESTTCPLEDYCSLRELQALCRVIGPSGVRVIDFEIVKIGHDAMKEIIKLFIDNKDLILGVEMDKFFGRERYERLAKRFQGLEKLAKMGVVVGSVILFRRLLRKALKHVVSDKDDFVHDTITTLDARLYNRRFYHEEFSHLALDVGIVNNYSDNVMRNVFFKLGSTDDIKPLWKFIPLVFGIAFHTSFWRGTKYDMRLGALNNNGFALADCVHNLISIFCDPGSHRKMKLSFLSIAGRSMLYLKQARPTDPSVNHLFLFLDHFVRNALDLTAHDLQTVSIPFDVIRAQMVRIYGDASGHFSEAQLADMQEDMKDDDE